MVIIEKGEQKWNLYEIVFGGGVAGGGSAAGWERTGGGWGRIAIGIAVAVAALVVSVVVIGGRIVRRGKKRLLALAPIARITETSNVALCLFVRSHRFLPIPESSGPASAGKWIGESISNAFLYVGKVWRIYWKFYLHTKSYFSDFKTRK